MGCVRLRCVLRRIQADSCGGPPSAQAFVCVRVQSLQRFGSQRTAIFGPVTPTEQFLSGFSIKHTTLNSNLIRTRAVRAPAFDVHAAMSAAAAAMLRKRLMKRHRLSVRAMVVGGCVSDAPKCGRRPRCTQADTARRDAVVAHWLALPEHDARQRLCFTASYPKLVQAIWQLNVNLLCAGLFRQASAVATAMHHAREKGAGIAARQARGLHGAPQPNRACLTGRGSKGCDDATCPSRPGGDQPVGRVVPSRAADAAQQFPLLEAVEFTNQGDGTLAVKLEALHDPQAFVTLVLSCVPDLLDTTTTTAAAIQPRGLFMSRFLAAAARCDTWQGLQQLVGTLIERSMLEAYFEELERRALQCMEALLASPAQLEPAGAVCTARAARAKRGAKRTRKRKKLKQTRDRSKAVGGTPSDVRGAVDGLAVLEATEAGTEAVPAQAEAADARNTQASVDGTYHHHEDEPPAGQQCAAREANPGAATAAAGAACGTRGSSGGTAQDAVACAGGRHDPKPPATGGGGGDESRCSAMTPPRAATPTPPCLGTSTSPSARVAEVCSVRLSDVAVATRTGGHAARPRSRSRSLVVSVSSADSALSAFVTSDFHEQRLSPSGGSRQRRCRQDWQLGPGRSDASRVGAFARVPSHRQRLPRHDGVAAAHGAMQAALQAKLEESYRVTSGMVGCAVDGGSAGNDWSMARTPHRGLGAQQCLPRTGGADLRARDVGSSCRARGGTDRGHLSGCTCAFGSTVGCFNSELGHRGRDAGYWAHRPVVFGLGSRAVPPLEPLHGTASTLYTWGATAGDAACGCPSRLRATATEFVCPSYRHSVSPVNSSGLPLPVSVGDVYSAFRGGAVGSAVPVRRWAPALPSSALGAGCTGGFPALSACSPLLPARSCTFTPASADPCAPWVPGLQHRPVWRNTVASLWVPSAAQPHGRAAAGGEVGLHPGCGHPCSDSSWDGGVPVARRTPQL